MAKLRVELDGPMLTECVILKDGQPLTQVVRLAVDLDAHDRTQLLNIGSIDSIDGYLFTSDVTHTIKRATINLEYEEV
jgi:hypothetical protein